ncbi:hypothetical protein D3C85_1414290 [compost metagenome]
MLSLSSVKGLLKFPYSALIAVLEMVFPLLMSCLACSALNFLCAMRRLLLVALSSASSIVIGLCACAGKKANSSKAAVITFLVRLDLMPFSKAM